MSAPAGAGRGDDARRGRRLTRHFQPGRRRRAGSSTRSTASRSASIAARRSGSSASRDRASRRWRGSCCTSRSRPRARSSSTDRTSSRPPPRELRQLRRKMQIVFQDPFASLNRRQTVEQIVSFPLAVHEGSLGREARRRRVSRAARARRAQAGARRAYPRQLSGGQCQRVSIARALALTRASSCSTRPSPRSTSRSRRRS